MKHFKLNTHDNNRFRYNLLFLLIILHIRLLRIRYYTSVFLSVYLLHRILNSCSMVPNCSKERLQNKQSRRFINDSFEI